MKPINKYLVNRRLTSEDRPKELTEEEVRSYLITGYGFDWRCKEVTIRYEHGEPIVDIEGDFSFREDITKIPFQFGTVTGSFSCEDCKNLTSLDGCPTKVGDIFSCSKCYKLKSLEGCPKEVGGHFYCRDCSRKFTEDEVRSLCDVKKRVSVG